MFGDVIEEKLLGGDLLAPLSSWMIDRDNLLTYFLNNFSLTNKLHSSAKQ